MRPTQCLHYPAHCWSRTNGNRTYFYLLLCSLLCYQLKNLMKFVWDICQNQWGYRGSFIIFNKRNVQVQKQSMFTWMLILIEEWPKFMVIKWKHCPRYWPFVRGIHRALKLLSSNWCLKKRDDFEKVDISLSKLLWNKNCITRLGWVNNREAGDLRRHRAHHDVTVMFNLVNDLKQKFHES